MRLKEETIERIIAEFEKPLSDGQKKRDELFYTVLRITKESKKYSTLSELWSRQFIQTMLKANKNLLIINKNDFMDYTYLMNTVYNLLYEYLEIKTDVVQDYTISKNRMYVVRKNDRFNNIPLSQFTLTKIVECGLVSKKFSYKLAELRESRNRVVHLLDDYPYTKDYTIIDFVMKFNNFREENGKKLIELCNDLLAEKPNKIKSF